MDATAPWNPKMPDRQTLEQRRGSDVVFGHDPVVSFTTRAKLLEPTDHVATPVPYTPAEQILQVKFIRLFRHSPCLPAASRRNRV